MSMCKLYKPFQKVKHSVVHIAVHKEPQKSSWYLSFILETTEVGIWTKKQTGRKRGSAVWTTLSFIVLGNAISQTSGNIALNYSKS